MAQIVFIINDEEDAVNVTAAAEPFIPLGEAADLTPAQHLAQIVAATLHAALTDPDPPKLEVVGDVDGDSDRA